MIAKKSVTIKEVARAAGVSAQTVSRVLNNHRDVSAGTRQRVHQVIDELGYSPNILARSLIQGRSHAIGVIGYGISYYGPSRVITGMERQASELGYSMLLSLVREPETASCQPMLNQLLMRKVDGIIWAIPEIGPHRLELLNEVNRISVPVVFINMQPLPDYWVAAVDNIAGGRMATQHLLDQGRRNIAVITGPETWLESRDREAGWRAAMLAAGLVDLADLAKLKATGDWYPESGERCMESLLQSNPEVDAVFAFNDQMALGAMKAARRLGRRIPQDLAVVGYDDVPEADFFCPPLTTLRQPLTDLGAKSVQILHSILSLAEGEPLTPEQKILQPELVIRASSLKSVQ